MHAMRTMPAPGGARWPTALTWARWRMVGLAGLAGLLFLLAGCSVMWVSTYDRESVDRSTEISRSVLKLYQDLLTTEPARRKAAVAGPLATRHADVETQMRLHLLKEQARSKNDEGTRVAENLLASWIAFSKNHRSDDASALADITLTTERGILERHLRAAFTAEEAKKLGGGGK